jgi:hypothetical protein
MAKDLLFSDVSLQFGPDGDFEVFRYATLAEVGQLFSNPGIPD